MYLAAQSGMVHQSSYTDQVLVRRVNLDNLEFKVPIV